MTERGISIKEYIDKRFDGFEKSIDDLKNNHFNHLEKQVEKVETKMDRNMWLLITTLVGLVVHAVGVIIHG